MKNNKGRNRNSKLKTKKEEEKKVIKRIVLLPDIHYPKQNKPAMKAVFEFIKWFKPTNITLIGDAMEMDSINPFKMSRDEKKHFQGKNLMKEYEGFDKEILTPLDKICEHSDKRRKPVEKIYMGGNHELWANSLIAKLPYVLENAIEPEKCLKLEERGWKWVPYLVSDNGCGVRRGMVQYGKLLVIHGHYSNKYHSAKMADMYSKSIAYGHVHDVQFYTKVFSDDATGYHTAQSIGCLCNTSPAFMRGRGNRWVNSFAVVYLQENGNFNLYTIIIIKGKFVFAGKLFGA